LVNWEVRSSLEFNTSTSALASSSTALYLLLDNAPIAIARETEVRLLKDGEVERVPRYVYQLLPVVSFTVAKVWWSAGVVGSWGLAAERLANEEVEPVP
jgi:hypothetical protein